MPTLFRRGRVWYIFSQVNGKLSRRSTGTTSRTEAEKILRDIRAELVRYRLSLPPSPILVKDAINQYLDGAHARLKPRTVRRYLEVFRHLLAFLPPAATRLSDVTTEIMEQYVNHRLGLGRCARTVQDELETFSTLFKWAIRMKRAVDNPIVNVSKLKIVHKTPHAWTVDELRAIFEHAGKYRDFYETLYRTAFRVSEALEIRVRDINLPGRKIIYHNLKAGRDEWSPMNESLVPILERRMRGRGRDDLIFPGEYKTHKRNWNQLRYDFQKMLKATGLPEGTLHDFKRTHITHMMNAGVHPSIVQASGHHMTITTTMSYSQGPGDLLQAAINKLPA